MIIYIGKVTHPSVESANNAMEKAVEGTALSAAEPGCVHYTHAQDCVDRRVIWIVHVYGTVADVEKHMVADFYPSLHAAVCDGSISIECDQYVGMQAVNMLLEE